MSKVVLSSKEAELLRAYVRTSFAALRSLKRGYEQYSEAIAILRKLGI